MTYIIGTNFSTYRVGACLSISIIHGSTQLPGFSVKIFPPYKTLPPYYMASVIEFLYVSSYILEWSGPYKVFGSSVSPIGIDP